MSNEKHNGEEVVSPLQPRITGEAIHKAMHSVTGDAFLIIDENWSFLCREKQKMFNETAEKLNEQFLAPLHASIAECQTGFRRLKDMDREIADDQDKEIARLQAEIEQQDKRIEALATALDEEAVRLKEMRDRADIWRSFRRACDELRAEAKDPEKTEELIRGVEAQYTKVLGTDPDRSVGEVSAAAVFGFMGWLTTREEVAGPFSSRHKAGQAAKLAGHYCDAQGWQITNDHWFEALKPVPPMEEQPCNSNN